MELKNLYTFRTIVKEGSFTKAAKALSYTQSTITFQIQQLEQELNTQLFEKVGRNMLLTKAGQQLIPYVDEVLSSVDKLKYFENHLNQCQGDLHIGVAESMLCYKLPPVLKEFHKKAPMARLFIKSLNCYDIRDELLSGNLDLGIFFDLVIGRGSNIDAHPIGSYNLVLVASPESKQKYPDFITPNRKMDIPFIIDEPDSAFRLIFENYIREKSIILDHTIELWSIPTIKNLVANDMGVSYLPRYAVEKELNDGSLVEIATEIDDIKINAVCGHHKNKWISPLMKLFIELCQEMIE